MPCVRRPARPAIPGAAPARIGAQASRAALLVLAALGACGAPAAVMRDESGAGARSDPGVLASAPLPPSPIPGARRTRWQPGIPGGVPARTALCATLDAAKLRDGAADSTAAIQRAIDACPANQVVQLAPGTYRLSRTLSLARPVVLRGAGPERTTLQMASGGVAVMIGNWTHFGAPIPLSADASKGSTALTVADASRIAVGDVLHLDQLDDPDVVQGRECPYLKRGAPGAWRSIGQMVEVAARRGNVLILGSPLHWTFRTSLGAEVVPLLERPTKLAGLEDLRIAGASNAAVNVQYATYSWVKNVETDHVNGVHVALAGTYRCVLRDSYAHHSTNYSYGGSSYGYSIERQASDNLVENNVVQYVNKPIQFRASGGGNVVAYNYVDDSWSRPDRNGMFFFQEMSIDSHCSFSHMELVEGNYAPHVGVMSTWGNAGNMTYFRNRSTSQFRTITTPYDNLAAVQLDARMVGMNVVGNVLGQPGLAGARYETASAETCRVRVPHVYRLNYDGAGGYCSFPRPGDTQTTDTLLRHGNFDYVTNDVIWDPAIADRTLPPSLYLAEKPGFFGSNPWPWVDPVGPSKVHVLPAKQRFDALVLAGTDAAGEAAGPPAAPPRVR